MRKTVKEAFKDRFAVFFGSILGVTFVLLVYTFVLSLYNPITIENNPVEPIDVKAGKSFDICRTVTYSREVKVDLSRAMTYEDINDGVHTISYPQFSILRGKGSTIVCRNIELPSEMKAGIWTVHTYVTVHTTPWWKTTFETDSFQIKVSK